MNAEQGRSPLDVDAEVRCAACLDSRRCWVCLGHGSTEDRYGGKLQCPACRGSGACPRCALTSASTSTAG